MNIVFEPSFVNQSKKFRNLEYKYKVLFQFAPLQVVQIYLDTTTFGEIARDVKVTSEAALGLIGGTMGLFTGFSILSGVEIVYYLLKLFLSYFKKRDRKQLNM